MSTVKKILVVDDDPVVAKSFDRVLAGKGYAVITAADGEEALRKLNTETYDVVFTDIKMPGMSGIEVAERVRKSQPWLPVVIVTGYGTEENEARAEAAGGAGVLRKPLSPEMIEGSTEKALLEAAGAPAAAPEAAAPANAAAEPVKAGSHLKNVALFLAAPFVGLAYILAFPFVGLGMLAWLAGKAMMRNGTVKAIAYTIAAPIVTLAFVVIGPVLALGALAWIGGNAILKR